MSNVKIFLLGSPRIERDGAPVEVDTRKATALLAYLVVSRQHHRRDALAALLWPDADQTSARGALRRTLSSLNKALGGVGVDAARETIGLSDDATLWCDVEQFERSLMEKSIGDLEGAVALYHDDFLAGFSLRDSATFDDWQFYQAERLRRALAGALERLVASHMEAGAFDEAVDGARRWLRLDPLHEPAHRRLMQLYAWSGQRGAALQQYRECVRVLDSELGVPPLEETTRLYEAIKDGRFDALPARVPQTASESAAEVPAPADPAPQPVSPHASSLVGRAAERAALLDAYAAIRGDGRLIVLEGEAGIGKTRLASELLAFARSQSAQVLVGRCYEGEGQFAYGPFVDALRMAAQSTSGAERLATLAPLWLRELARVMPELERYAPEGPPALDTAAAQNRFFEAVSQALLALCAGSQPGVLFIDDAHWADAASLELLAYLVRRLQGRSMCLLMAWRDERGVATDRARVILAEARRAGNAIPIPLARLDRAAVLDMVQTSPFARAGWSEALGGRLFEETEGLPFFVVEYLATLAQHQPQNGTDWPVPSGVRDLLHARLASVSETGAQVLTTAAVIGRSFDYDTLRDSSGRSDDETVEALEQLMARGLIQELRGDGGAVHLEPRYDFYHEKLRALIYDDTSFARRRLLHRRVAETLVNRTRAESERALLAGQIAHHYHQAGQDAQAADYFYQAGEQARNLYANVDALTHFRAALALGHPATAALHEALGDLHTLLGEYRAALTSYETAGALHPPNALARIERKLADIERRRGAWDLAENHLRAALDALGPDATAERARIYADWSLTAHRRDRPAHARELAQTSLEFAEKSGDARALLEAHNILGILHSRAEELRTAREHLGRSLELAEILGDEGARAAALNNLALVFGASSDTDRAVEAAEAALGIYTAQGDRHRIAALHNTLADFLHAAGRSDDAMSHLKRAVAIFADIGIDIGEMQPEIWKLVEW